MVENATVPIPEETSPAERLARISNAPYFNRKLRFVTAVDTSGRWRLAAVSDECTCRKD